MSDRIRPLNGAIPVDGPTLQLIDYKITAEKVAPQEWLISASIQHEGETPHVWLAGFEDESGQRFGRLMGLTVPVPFRKAGIARKLMESAIQGAGKLGLTLLCIDAAPYEDRPMTIAQLKDFYASVGFVAVEGHPTAMVRRMESGVQG